jgi:hypothetical protein
VSTLDDRIDALYARPLPDFTAERNALAKSLSGAERQAVKTLQKPTTVAWAVNLLFWREQKTFDRLLRAGHALRTAQLAALKGRSSDIRGATAQHRDVLADAVSTARQLAADAGSAPEADGLSRMLEAISVAPQQPDHPGRWTEAIQPAGFEALAGITPIAHPKPTLAAPPVRPRDTPPRAGHAPVDAVPSVSKRDLAAERRRAEAEAARRRAAEAAMQAARQEADRASAAEARAAAQVEHARQQLAHAEAALTEAREHAARARRALADAKG